MIEQIKSKITAILQNVQQKHLDGEIWADERVEIAKQRIDEVLTDEERREIGNIKIGIRRGGDDILAKFRGETVNSFKASRHIELDEFRRILREENKYL
jgi:hypothetical protein